MRACSKRRPTIERTVIVSETPGKPTQTADTANDTFDLHTGAAGFIKNLDHFIVNQLVALDDDMAVAVLLVLVDFAADQLGNAGRKVCGETSSLR